MFVVRCSRGCSRLLLSRATIFGHATASDGEALDLSRRDDDGPRQARQRRRSVYWDQSNECYFATWTDPTGKRRKARGKTQAEAQRRRDEAIDEHAQVARGPSRFTPATTVRELAEWWLANVAPHRMRPSSVGTVGKRLTRERLGVLSDVAVAKLTSEQVQEWQSSMFRGDDKLSPSTVADTRVTLNQVLDSAVDHHLISVNPARRKMRGKSELWRNIRQEGVVVHGAELSALAEAVDA